MSKKNCPIVGITSIGSGVGQSVVDSCRFSRLPMKLIGLGANPFAYGAFDCDARDELPSIYAADYLDVLLDKCLQYGVNILVPGLDDELLPLSRNAQRFRDNGIDVIVSGEKLLELCRDKERMSQELSEFSSAFVETFSADRMKELAHQSNLRFPLIAKPRAGFASRGIAVLNSEEDFYKVTPDHIVQTIAVPRKGDVHRDAFLDGLRKGFIPQIGEVSAQVVFNKSGKELGRMVTYNKLANGVPIEIIPMESPGVWAAIDQLLPRLVAMGLRGPLNIQGRITDAGPKFFEMNARFTGITGLRAMIGFNEVDAVIRDAIGQLPENFRLDHNRRRIGMRQVANRVVDVGLDASLSCAVASTGCHVDRTAGKRILVTGANSYLGRACLSELLKTEGVGEIVALVREPSRFADGRETPLPDAVVVHDVTDLLNGILNLGNVDILVHLASGRPIHDNDAISDSLRFTRDLMTLATKHHIPGIINASSTSVYGLSRPPMWHESMLPIPETPYAQAKWASELMAAMAREINNVTAVTSLRLAQLIGMGDGMRWTEVPHIFMKKAVLGERISVRGGQQFLDFVNVDDAARVISLLCVRPFDAWPPVVNVGSGAPIRLMEFAELVDEVTQELLGRKAEIENVAASINLEMGMNIDLAHNILGWSPSKNLKASLTDIARSLIAVNTR